MSGRPSSCMVKSWVWALCMVSDNCDTGAKTGKAHEPGSLGSTLKRDNQGLDTETNRNH